jgi:LmbE family N-acetylglucosaminyl deacetylase
VVSRRQFLAGVVSTAGAAAMGGHLDRVSHAAWKTTEVVYANDVSNVSNAMYIVAHADDSLLFQSPSLLQNIQSNGYVYTVHLTAGDDGMGEDYWGDREAGMEAAYAQMAGAANSWTASTLTVGSHQIVLETLTAQPNIMLVFMRLPDGGYPDGNGTALYGYQSLMQLWQGTESTITAVDDSTSYSLQDLINTLAAMMSAFQPQLIATQDFVNTFGDGDHMDHYATADLAQSAHVMFTSPHNFVGYEGYPVTSHDPNVSGGLLAVKQAVFYTYGGFDENTCSSAASCSTTSYVAWLERQYTVGSEPVGVVANAGFDQIVDMGAIVQLDGSMSSEQSGDPLSYLWTETAGSAVTLSSATIVNPTFTAPTGPASLTFSLVVSNGSQSSAPSTVTITVAAASGADTNVALVATATASSQNTSTGQLASSAIDGVISGYPNDDTAEWATVSGGVGSWLLLTWATSYTLDHVVLYDRPNLNDQITSGTLTFSDATSVSFGSLPNDASSGLTVNFPAKTTTSLKMTVTGVSSTSLNIGLSEIQAWGVQGTTSDTPTASAGTAQSVASGASVSLDGSGSSDPNDLALTYAWTETAGSAVTLSSATIVNPTFTAPTGPASLTFSLVVSNGSQSSAPSTVTITVAAASGADTNVALVATATASSQNTSTGQLASSAIDGVISGYPNDDTAEWATVSGGVGSWLLLTWATSYTLDHVVLYDRPNLNDQITSGTLTFSDATSVSFGSLPNDASSGLTVNFPAKTTTSLKMTVTGVSSTSLNIGLSEIQAWGVQG